MLQFSAELNGWSWGPLSEYSFSATWIPLQPAPNKILPAICFIKKEVRAVKTHQGHGEPVSVAQHGLKDDYTTLLHTFLCRKEAGERKKGKRARNDGKGKDRKWCHPFLSSHRPPRASYFLTTGTCNFLGNIQQKSLPMRELLYH